MKENAVRNCSGVLCLCGCAGAPQVAICRGAWPGTVRRCVSDVLVLECVRKGVRYHPVLFGCVRKWYPPHQCVCHCRNQRYTHVTNHTDDNHTHTSRTTGAHEPWHSHVTIGLAEPKRSPLGPGRATSNTSRYVMSMQRCAGVSLARTRNATWHMSCYTLSVREHVAIPHTQTRFNSDLAYNLECQSNLRHDSGSTP
jgi:hypothetical protein